MSSIESLKDKVVYLLGEAGFTPDLYIIKIHESSVSVHFDSPGAVEYFRKEVESSAWAADLIFDSQRDGKRYVANIQLW